MGIGSFSAVVCWTVVFGLLLGLGFSVPDIWVDTPASFEQQYPVSYNYDRLDEVKKECKPVLSSASELTAGGVRILYDILTFENGDWTQTEGKSPIMPFDARYRNDEFRVDNYTVVEPKMDSPLSLVSFLVKDVSHREHRTKNWIALSGLLNLAMVGNGGFADNLYDREPQFRIWSGQSQLTIRFEGVYTENEENERVVCLLGNAMLPERDADDTSNPWKWVNESSPFDSHRPPLMEDDRILLTLRFPKIFTLTNRVIRGAMSSLNPSTSPRYFDNVEITSQMGRSSNYDFTSDKLVSKACSPYPYKNDSLLFPGISVYKGDNFCNIVEEIARNQFLTVLPNWKCSTNDSFCDKLGPFAMNKEISATDGGFKGVSLHMQVIKCKPTNQGRNGNFARVSALFRAIPPSENRHSSMRRSGISNMALAAEGLWNSSSGQLCMIGCLGFSNSEGNGCNSRICLYIPTSFSIRQRSVIYGVISSISTNPPLFFPLSVEKLISQPMDLWTHFQSTKPSYNYTMCILAGALEEKHESLNLRTMIKKSVLTFPKLDDSDSFQSSLSYLSEDLSISAGTVSNSKALDRRSLRPTVQIGILSLDTLFGQYWSNFSSIAVDSNQPYRTEIQYSEKQLLLNVSAHLSISGDLKEYSNVSSLFLEGLYDQRIGKIYAYACRDVRASAEVLFESGDLDDGLDCEVEVVVSYPPTTSRWISDPNAKISISSRRTEDDPLYFGGISIKTYPITYRKQREDVLSRAGVEGILRIVTLSMAVSFILSQLFHIMSNAESVPFMSLVMLGVQSLGYILPLVTDAEALFKKRSSDTYESPSYYVEKSRWLHAVDYTVKLLVMVALLLTLRLCQKVWKSRARLISRSPQDPHRVPSDKKVLLSTFVMHVIGYAIVLLLHSMGIGKKPTTTRYYEYPGANSNSMSDWEAELEEYIGLVQDFYLLPQVIGNLIWQLDSKPLRKLYYFGITVVRLLPHLYDWIRPASVNPYLPQEYDFVDPNTDFYSKFGDVAIPLIAIVLAGLVYAQQRWNYEKLSRSIRLLPRASRAYERLPAMNSQVFEAELTSSVNGNSSKERDSSD